MNPFLAGETQASSPVPQRASAQAMRGFYRAARMLALAAGVSLSAAAGAAAIDANTATAEQLQEIKGIGPRTAELIVSERERSGPFVSLEDFTDRIRGIGPRRAEAFQAAGLVVGARASETPQATGARSENRR